MHREERCFSPTERESLSKVARAAMPAGRVFPAAGEKTVDKVDHFLALCRPDGGARLSRDAAGARRLRRWRATAVRWRRCRRRTAGAARALARAATIARRTRGAHADRAAQGRALQRPADVRPTSAAATARCRCAAERPRWMQERVIAAAELDGDDTIECDVVVIGTGAGGAVVRQGARRARPRGRAARGGRLPHARRLHRPRRRDAAQALPRHGRDAVASATRSSRSRSAAPSAARPTINSGTCYRTPDRVLDKWRARARPRRAVGRDDGALLRARRGGARRRAGRRRSYLGGVARVIARGCDALGFTHQPLRRNAPECDGQGVCCFGCPTDAKRSTNVSYVPLALKAGAHAVHRRCAPSEILVDGGRAVGVVARGGAATARRVRSRCARARSSSRAARCSRRCCSSASGSARRRASSAATCRSIRRWRCWRSFDETLDGGNAIPQGYAIEEFHDEGILFEGAFAPLDIGAASFTMIGPRFVELLEALPIASPASAS